MPSVAIPSRAPSVHRENCDQHHRFPKSLTKREIKCLNANIEELDFEGSVYDWAFLPDELIESGLSNFAGAVLSRINTAVFPGSGAIQSHDKPHGLAVLRRSQHQVQVAAVEAEHDLARHCLQHGAFGINVPRPAQSPMIQREFPGFAENLNQILVHFFR